MCSPPVPHSMPAAHLSDLVDVAAEAIRKNFFLKDLAETEFWWFPCSLVSIPKNSQKMSPYIWEEKHKFEIFGQFLIRKSYNVKITSGKKKIKRKQKVSTKS